MQLVGGHLLLVADNARGAGDGQVEVKKNNKVDLQVEGLVELWRPIAGLLFGLELPLLIRKMRTYSGG